MSDTDANVAASDQQPTDRYAGMVVTTNDNTPTKADPEPNQAQEQEEQQAEKPSAETPAKSADSDDEQKQPEPAGDEAESSAGDDDETEHDTDRKGGSGGRAQKRIKTLTKKASQAEARAEKAEREASELRARLESKEPESEELDPEDFDNLDDYVAAQRKQKKAKKPEPDEQQSKDDDQGESDSYLSDPEFIAARDYLIGEVEDAADQYPGLSESMKKGVSITSEMVIAMSETDQPVEVINYLVENKAESDKIAKMSPRAQAVAIGKIEANLNKAPPKPIKKASKAPEPINPVRNSGQAAKPVEEMSFSEYEAKRQKERQQDSGW